MVLREGEKKVSGDGDCRALFPVMLPGVTGTSRGDGDLTGDLTGEINGASSPPGSSSAPESLSQPSPEACVCVRVSVCARGGGSRSGGDGKWRCPVYEYV